jgi:hypothetical protein
MDLWCNGIAIFCLLVIGEFTITEAERDRLA